MHSNCNLPVAEQVYNMATANQSCAEPLVRAAVIPGLKVAVIPGLKTVGASSMSDSYIIEVSSRAAGIVVRDRAGFRFFAAAPQFGRLEGQLFRSAREAERAAAQYAERSDQR